MLAIDCQQRHRRPCIAHVRDRTAQLCDRSRITGHLDAGVQMLRVNSSEFLRIRARKHPQALAQMSDTGYGNSAKPRNVVPAFHVRSDCGLDCFA